MKRLLFFLLLAPMLAFGQRLVVVEFEPIVNPTKLDSIVTIVGEDTLRCFRGFQAVGYFVEANHEGKRFICTDSTDRFPWDATITEYIDSATVVTSDTALASDSLATIQVDYFGAVQYASGDAIGWPMEIDFLDSNFVTLPREYIKLEEVIVVDSSDQGGNLDLLFMSAPNKPTEDNAALATPESDAWENLGYVLVDSWQDYGASDVGYETPDLYLPILGKRYMYCQVVSKGTATYTSGRCLRVKLVFLVK